MNELYYFQDGKSEETLRGKWGEKQILVIFFNLR